jgi:L-aspartate oxidase
MRWPMSLLMRDGECRGAAFIGRDGKLEQVDAARTLIATGGAGQVFRETTNPAIATGDGIAMALRGGARVTDLEFIQFHPTALSVEGARAIPDLRRRCAAKGAWLVNADGRAVRPSLRAAGDSCIARFGSLAPSCARSSERMRRCTSRSHI